MIINLYQKIDKFEPIINRIDSESIESMRAESGEKMTENKITIEDFIKLDLRIGTIVEAEEVEDSRKMLKLRINLGEDTRTVLPE